MSRYDHSLKGLFATDDQTHRTADEVALLVHCSEHPWNMVTAEYHDPRTRHNQPLVRTRDEENVDRNQRIRPFPHYKHLKALMDFMYDPPVGDNGRWRPLIIPKARRSIVSYGVCTFELWETLHQPASNWMNAKHDKADASRLMREKIKATYELLPDFFQRAHPMRFSDGDKGYEAIGPGGIIVPAESGFHKGSGLGVAGSFFFDEAPLMRQLRAAYEKILPTAALLVLAGTPPGHDDDFDPDSLEFFASFFEERVEIEDGL